MQEQAKNSCPPLSSEASSRRMNKEDGKVKRGSQGKKEEKDVLWDRRPIRASC
jgi:hypothetical protein